MEVVIRSIRHASRSDVIRVYPLGDTHIGSAACDEKAIEKIVARIAEDPNSYWIGMGDYCEFINRSDPRFDPRSLAKWIKVQDLADISKAQVDRFLKIIDPIKSKCLALAQGNHEHTIARYYERSVYHDILKPIRNAVEEPIDRLGLGFSGVVKLRVENGPKDRSVKSHSWVVNFFAHHGWGGGRLAGGKALKLERTLLWYDCEVILIGHWHSIEVVKRSPMGVTRNGKLFQKDRVALGTGTWLRGLKQGVETYAEQKGYPPNTIGCSWVELRPGTKEINAVV
jgi:hypothetical protein